MQWREEFLSCDSIIEEHTGLPVVYITHQTKTEKFTFRPLTIEVGGRTSYYHGDELGNVLALTDDQGHVLERYDYEDYGVPHFLNADGTAALGSDGLPATSSAWGNPFLFHGMSWEQETQLYFEKGWPCRYEGPRFYDARIGRNTTRAMTVNEARPMEPRMTGGGSGNNPWTADADGKSQILQRGKRIRANDEKRRRTSYALS